MPLNSVSDYLSVDDVQTVAVVFHEGTDTVNVEVDHALRGDINHSTLPGGIGGSFSWEDCIWLLPVAELDGHKPNETTEIHEQDGGNERFTVRSARLAADRNYYECVCSSMRS